MKIIRLGKWVSGLEHLLCKREKLGSDPQYLCKELLGSQTCPANTGVKTRDRKLLSEAHWHSWTAREETWRNHVDEMSKIADLFLGSQHAYLGLNHPCILSHVHTCINLTITHTHTHTTLKRFEDALCPEGSNIQQEFTLCIKARGIPISINFLFNKCYYMNDKLLF